MLQLLSLAATWGYFQSSLFRRSLVPRGEIWEAEHLDSRLSDDGLGDQGTH